ncbi:unnamed protein product [Camellia sinensis]
MEKAEDLDSKGFGVQRGREKLKWVEGEWTTFYKGRDERDTWRDGGSIGFCLQRGDRPRELGVPVVLRHNMRFCGLLR